jgi:hypothetical protein
MIRTRRFASLWELLRLMDSYINVTVKKEEEPTT